MNWTPSTHHQVPQPAGHQCADWYERVQPPAVEILYALAHTKGELDEVLDVLRDLIVAEDDYGDETNVAVNQKLEKARAVLAKFRPKWPHYRLVMNAVHNPGCKSLT